MINKIRKIAVLGIFAMSFSSIALTQSIRRSGRPTTQYQSFQLRILELGSLDETELCLSYKQSNREFVNVDFCKNESTSARWYMPESNTLASFFYRENAPKNFLSIDKSFFLSLGDSTNSLRLIHLRDVKGKKRVMLHSVTGVGNTYCVTRHDLALYGVNESNYRDQCAEFVLEYLRPEDSGRDSNRRVLTSSP